MQTERFTAPFFVMPNRRLRSDRCFPIFAEIYYPRSAISKRRRQRTDFPVIPKQDNPFGRSKNRRPRSDFTKQIIFQSRLFRHRKKAGGRLPSSLCFIALQRKNPRPARRRRRSRPPKCAAGGFLRKGGPRSAAARCALRDARRTLRCNPRPRAGRVPAG